MGEQLPTCPECEGEHAHDLEFRHGAHCHLGAADRRKAEEDLLYFGDDVGFVRRATLEEEALARPFGVRASGSPAHVLQAAEVRRSRRQMRVVITNGARRRIRVDHHDLTVYDRS